MIEDKKTNKKVLLISFAFPPIGGSGVQRVLKFAKYLPSFGYRPIILTVKAAVFPVYNQINLKEISHDLKVYRTNFIDFLNIKRMFVKESSFEKEANRAKNIEDKRRARLHFSGLLKPLLKFFNQYFLIPDDKIGWIPFAVKEGLKIIKEENIDVIYTTGDPFSVFLTGYLLKKITGKKWVVDYRDSWTDFSLSGFKKGNYRMFVENFFESRVLKNADKIISVSPLINEKLQNKYKNISKDKYIFLPNGYDADDFKEVAREKRVEDKFIIVHAGIFNKARSPELFLKALREFLNENYEQKDRVEVRFIGASYDEDINEMIQKYKLSDNLKISRYKEHHECIEEIVNADALLLIQGYNNLEAFGGKLFEYLYTGNPILGIVSPQGCAGKLIRETGSGIVVKENTTGEIKRAIRDLYFNRRISQSHEKIKEYDRFKITQKLAGILNCL